MTRKKTVKRICQSCQTDFMAEQREVNRGAAKYCSISCGMKFRNSLNPGNPIEIFYKNISRDHHSDGCWIYKRLENTGYGSITIKRKSVRAHRFSYILYFGQIPDGMLVCHKCDRPSCVAPDHLFLGSSKDNRQDMIKKGRGNFPRGNKQPSSVLNDEKVHEIKLKLLNGERTIDIAKEYLVKRNVVTDIKRNKNWKHVML